jgi:hypothetical protein
MSTQNTHGGRLTGAVRTAGVGAYAAPNVSQNLSVSYVPPSVAHRTNSTPEMLAKTSL